MRHTRFCKALSKGEVKEYHLRILEREVRKAEVDFLQDERTGKVYTVQIRLTILKLFSAVGSDMQPSRDIDPIEVAKLNRAVVFKSFTPFRETSEPFPSGYAKSGFSLNRRSFIRLVRSTRSLRRQADFFADLPPQAFLLGNLPAVLS
uniref:Uncharacterized protein n=1 Tax=Trichuris muris TaxID=70415 RepID=A0A5S6QDD3_TRIMR